MKKVIVKFQLVELKYLAGGGGNLFHTITETLKSLLSQVDQAPYSHKESLNY